MKHKLVRAVIPAVILLLTLAACGKPQLPAPSGRADSAAPQTEQQSGGETSGEEASPAREEASGDASAPASSQKAGDEPAPDGSEEASEEEEPWKAALAEDLLEKYGVLPEFYEDLGGGIYQVYVEVGGEVVPFVTVDSATGDYHG